MFSHPFCCICFIVQPADIKGLSGTRENSWKLETLPDKDGVRDPEQKEKSKAQPEHHPRHGPDGAL